MADEYTHYKKPPKDPGNKFDISKAAGYVPAALDIANIISQNALINKTQKIKESAKLLPAPEISLAVRTPRGLTAEQKAAAENQLLSQGPSYYGSDFNKTLVSKNMQNARIQAGRDALAARDAELYRSSYDKSLEEENMNRQLKHGIAMENTKRAQDLADFKMEAKLDAVSNRRALLSDMFKGLKTTMDSDAAYEAGNQEATRQSRLKNLQSQVDFYSYMMSTASPEEISVFKVKRDEAQEALEAEMNKSLPTRRSLYGTTLIPRR